MQLSDTGLIPGSGVGNHRRAVDRAALGVPVIAVGVPTVIDGATLCADLLEEAGRPQQDLSGRGADLFVTPQDIDQRVTELGRIVGYGITLALQRGLTLEDVTGPPSSASPAARTAPPWRRWPPPPMAAIMCTVS